MNIKLAFLGYRDEWELDRARELASGEVEVDGVPLEPAETLQERGTALAESANVVIPWRFQISADLADHGNLKLVQALSAGTDYLPVKDLYSRGVLVAGTCLSITLLFRWSRTSHGECRGHRRPMGRRRKRENRRLAVRTGRCRRPISGRAQCRHWRFYVNT